MAKGNNAKNTRRMINDRDRLFLRGGTWMGTATNARATVAYGGQRTPAKVSRRRLVLD
jgi:hypothetical protein